MGEMNREAGYKRSLADISPIRPKIGDSNNQLQINLEPSREGSNSYAYRRELRMAGYNDAEIMIAYTKEQLGIIDPISLAPGEVHKLENS